MALLLTVACTPEAPLGNDTLASYEIVVDTPAELRNKVDLLFVIDNSANMAARQKELSHSLQSVFSQLEFGRGLPDLHIGVVTTDMGIGEYATDQSQCSALGQDAQLKIASSDCGIADDFLIVQADSDGEISANMLDDIGVEKLSDQLSCMVERGEEGCEYEQPLEAMRSALRPQGGQAKSFVRRDAVLAVVIVTDEDDCSAYDSALFDPENARFRGDDPNFRCFQSGVICDGDDVYQPGRRDGCRPWNASPYVTRVSQYAEFLKTLKPDPRDRIVTAIIGDSGEVGVQLDPWDDAELVPSCKDQSGAAIYPGIRLSSFVDSLGDQGIESSLCLAEEGGYLSDMVRRIRSSLGTSCLEGPIRDIAPEIPGRQVDCYVYQQIEEERQTRQYFEECDNKGDLANSTVLPCYAIQTGGEACNSRTQLTLQIFGRKAPLADGLHTVAECQLDSY